MSFIAGTFGSWRFHHTGRDTIVQSEGIVQGPARLNVEVLSGINVDAPFLCRFKVFGIPSVVVCMTRTTKADAAPSS